MIKNLKLDKYLNNINSTNKINIVGPQIDNLKKLEEPIIFVDGGAKNRKGSEGISVGDGDSFDGFLDVRLPTTKNFSDLCSCSYSKTIN